MKTLYVAFFITLFSFSDSFSQSQYYFSSCYMNGDLLTVGRAKVFTNVFAAGEDANIKQLQDQYWDYLHKIKPNQFDEEYFKYKGNTWGDAAVKNVKVYGPFTYLKATQMLRKQVQSTRSRDWLVLHVDGFAFYPSKFKSLEN